MPYSLLQQSFLADGAQGDVVALGFYEQVVASLHPQLFSERFGGNIQALSMEILVAIDGILLWV